MDGWVTLPLSNTPGGNLGNICHMNNRGLDPILAAAHVIRKFGAPDEAERLIARHVADRSGYCRGCQSQTHSTRWPCVYVAIAEAVQGLRHRAAAR